MDHHLGNRLYGVANWVDTEAPAVAEMVLRLAHALNAPIDAATANALYLGLSTDTGSFRFSNATPRAFDAAAELVRLGARPEQIAGWLYESRPPGAVRLLGEVLETLELHCEQRIASVRLELDMFDRAGAAQTDSEGLIDHPRSIRGVEAVALFRERPVGDVKVSLRSRGRVDVGAIASRRGGGGHRNAAGCLIGSREDESGVIAELGAAVEATAQFGLHPRHGAGGRHMTPRPALHGLLLVDKRPGGTSHDVVRAARRALGERKIGHCGTLDPNATGLLLLTVGRSTRLTRFLIGAPKVYEGEIRFGIATDTYDAAGEVTREGSVADLTHERVVQAMCGFEGQQHQLPPLYSAKKIGGRKYYELARRGGGVRAPGQGRGDLPVRGDRPPGSIGT